MHVDQALEAVLLAAVEEPIDRALLIYFQMICVEIIDEVTANDISGRTLSTESICNEAEVFFQ